MKRMCTAAFLALWLALTGGAAAQEASYADGIYRGFYYDGGIEQIAIQFELRGGVFQSVVYRGVKYKDGDYMSDDASDAQKAALRQYRELAAYLVGKGVPFRDAHHVSGSLVGKCVHEGRALEDLSLEELRAAHPAFDEDVYQAISLEACVERRSLQGGPAPQAVSASIKRLDRWLDAHADGAEA